MKRRTSIARHPSLTPIAAGLLLFCNSSAWAANTITVQNCNDSGTGSLRAAVASANSGDTIDLSTLSCTKITLTTGAIPIAQDNLIITGPGADQLSIDGDWSSFHYNRIFTHSGTGTLHVNQVTLTDTRFKGATYASGGCILSSGSVALNQTTVSYCVALAQGAGFLAEGGGIFAEKGATVVDSTITGNVAWAGNSSAQARGGGLAVYGGLTIKYSTISDNAAVGGMQDQAGGIFASNGSLFVLGSTISGNAAMFEGGMLVTDYTGPHSLEIINSTISENFAFKEVAGLAAWAPLTLANSTIAFNHSQGHYYGTGFEFLNAHGTALTLQSTIIANNYNDDGTDSDTYIPDSAVFTGANNLVTSHLGPVPADTLTACPRIGPLENHGGKTLTHALLKGSPALDAGNNAASGLSYDQRGTGFPRTHGAQTDIGAFEDHGVIQDMIFKVGFEGRCR